MPSPFRVSLTAALVFFAPASFAASVSAAPTGGALASPLASGVASPRLAPEADAMPIGFEALALESEAGIDVREATARLMRVLADVRQKLDRSAEPLAALSVIAEAVGRVCTQLVDEAANGLISGALAEGSCDCDILTVAYLTVGEEVGLPLHAVFLPRHALILWDDGHNRVYWETTAAEERPAWLVEELVPDGAEETYLQPQSREEMMGYFYQVRANYRFARGDASGADEDFATAERLNPTLVLTYYNRGRTHLLRGDYDRAVADFDQALELDPTYADALYNRAVSRIALNRPADALRDLDALTAETGPAPDVSHARGLAYVSLGRNVDAVQAYEDALAMDPDYLLGYLARGRLYDQMGRTEAAVRDYTTFLRLAPGTEHASAIPSIREKLRAIQSGGS